MNVASIVNEAIAIADELVPQQGSKLRSLQKSVERRGLKIVVMGDFKTGKSTLINKVFLKKDLLPVEYREATAVPTHLTEGDLCLRAYTAGSATPAVELENVEAATIAQYITAAEDKARAELAEKFSHVELSMPGILPAGITLVDTPGLDTTNISVMESTQKEARDADGIIYVCRASQLSISQRDTIRNLCGNKLMQFPLHVVLTVASTQTPAQVADLQREIEADLSNHGITARCSAFYLNEQTERGINVAPVAGWRRYGAASVAVPDEAPSVGAQVTRSRRFASTPEAAPVIQETTTTPAGNTGLNDELKKTLERFICTNVYNGRMARVARELKPVLDDMVLALETRLSVSDKSDEQLAAMQAKLLDTKRQYMAVVEELLLDVRKAQLAYQQAISSMFKDIQSDCENKLNNAQDVAALWQVVDEMKTFVKDDIAVKIETHTLDYQMDVRKISLKYEQDLRSRLKLDELNKDIELDMGFLAKIPAWLVQVVDFAIIFVASPLPWFLDAPLRILAGKLVWLRKILPANLVAAVLRQRVSQTICTALTTMRANMKTQLDASFGECLESLRYELENCSQFNNMTAEIEAVAGNKLSVSDKTRLQNTVTTIQNWIQEI